VAHQGGMQRHQIQGWQNKSIVIGICQHHLGFCVHTINERGYGMDKLFSIALLSGSILFLLAENVSAYLDPGVGSMVLQVLAVVGIAVIVTVKGFWQKFRNIVFFWREQKSDTAGDDVEEQ
jgi:hypothetical protein